MSELTNTKLQIFLKHWRTLALIAVALAGVASGPGFQVLLGNIRALRWGWQFFFFAAAYYAAGGLAAALIAMVSGELVPHAFFFLAGGGAMLAGLRLVRRLFASRFADGR